MESHVVKKQFGSRIPVAGWCRRLALGLGLAGLLFGGSARAAGGLWALVDTVAESLSVRDGSDRVVAEYGGIAIGRGGAAAVHYRGDHTTPRGTFHIVSIRPSRRFMTFYELDYPTVEHAERAFRAGRLDAASRDAIVTGGGDEPLQGTALGGDIGIHGVGLGDPRIHRLFNWTAGCVALSNRQLRDFSGYAFPGMRVVIR